MASNRECKRCPDCAERVLAAAGRCSYCGYRFDHARQAHRSFLADLLPDLRSGTRGGTLSEMLADWGLRLSKGEEIAFFRFADVDDRPGYVVLSSERFVFFARGRGGQHERVLEYPLSIGFEVRVLGGRWRRRVELRGPTFGHWVRGLPSADIERLVAVAGIGPREASGGDRPAR